MKSTPQTFHRMSFLMQTSIMISRPYVHSAWRGHRRAHQSTWLGRVGAVAMSSAFSLPKHYAMAGPGELGIVCACVCVCVLVLGNWVMLNGYWHKKELKQFLSAPGNTSHN